MDLSNYSAVVHLDSMIGNCGGNNKDMPLSGQRALVDYVRKGGTFVQFEWSTCRYNVAGQLQGLRDLLLFDRSGESGGDLPTQVVNAGDPLLEGIPSTFQIAAHYNIGILHLFSQSPARLLIDSNGLFHFPFMATRDFGGGHVIGFAIACNSVYPCMGNPCLQRLLVNAISAN